jgi:hypothetical protein
MWCWILFGIQIRQRDSKCTIVLIHDDQTNVIGRVVICG